MENASHAIYMAMAMLLFVIGFTYALYMVNRLTSTVDTLVYRIDETNYYDSVAVEDWVSDSDDDVYKIVGIDSIIPTLYRYYKESFCVKIVDKNGNLLQLFDTTVEGEVNTASTLSTSARSDQQKALLALYNTSGEAYYLYGAPWISDTEDAKMRVDMYIAGKKGYINNVLVDYSKKYSVGGTNKYIYLNYYEGKSFKEIFSIYTYEGDTLTVETTDEGEAYETITGTQDTSSKIVITYQLTS